MTDIPPSNATTDTASTTPEPLAPRTLQNGSWQVGVLPETGACLAFGRLWHRGQWIDVLRPTPPDGYREPGRCASFPLVPWSNRIKGAQFGFMGKTYRLRPNSDDGTAIHGIGRHYPWSVTAAEPTRISMQLDSTALDGEPPNFPWPFRAKIEYRLDGARFIIETCIRNTGEAPFPAGFGHHPYFMRTLTVPQDRVQLELPCAQHFPLDHCIPVGPPQAVPSRLDFRRLRTLEPVFIDDNLTGRLAGRPVLIVYPRANVALTMRMDPIFEHIILYTPLRKPFFAVEPVTNANNGFNLYAEGVPGSGVFVLEPGQSARGTITLEVSHL